MKRGSTINRLLDFYLGIPALNLLASLRRKRQRSLKPVRIGIMFNPALGDTLLGSAVIQDIRMQFPSAQIVVFATIANLSAVQLLPCLDRMEVLSLTRPIECIQTIRRCKLDLMLDFTAWQRTTAIYSLMSGAQYTIGFERERQHRHRGYDECIRHRGNCHELENLRRLARAVAARTRFAPRLVIQDEPDSGLRQKSARVVVFHAWASGNQGSQREWPIERWIELAARLRRPERLFLITGAPADAHRSNNLVQSLLKRGIDAETLIGKNGLGEIARSLRDAELLISVNTGIMHLGAILGTPTVSINGPTSALRWGPVGPKVANVNPPDNIGGFLDLGFEYRGHVRDVMRQVSVDSVMQAAERLCGAQIQIEETFTCRSGEGNEDSCVMSTRAIETERLSQEMGLEQVNQA